MELGLLASRPFASMWIGCAPPTLPQQKRHHHYIPIRLPANNKSPGAEYIFCGASDKRACMKRRFHAG
jgi:hypothetical protein